MLSLVLAALLHLRLERAQRGKRRVGIERRLGWRRRGVHVGARPLLAVAAAPFVPPAARLAFLRAGFGARLLPRRLVRMTRARLAPPFGSGVERATFAPWPPHLLPLPLGGARGRCGVTLGPRGTLGRRLGRRREGRWERVGLRRGKAGLGASLTRRRGSLRRRGGLR